jgi:PAP2 superfamily
MMEALSTSEFAQIGAERAPGFRFERWTAVRWTVLLAYFTALVVWSANYGIPVQRELVVAWTCGALACASIGRHPREIARLAGDWLPMMVVLAAYDFTRGAADSLGIGVHYHAMIDFDRFLFAGQTPTEWLQAHLFGAPGVHWWNVAFTLVYTSYFIVPFALAGVLWVRDRPGFLRFRRRLVTLALAGLATYLAFPAAPPWLASEMGLLHHVERTTSEGWDAIGIGTAGLFSEGQASVNLVAAVPSLHVAFCALIAFFLWNRIGRRRLRPLLLLYPLAMAFTLVSTGEHYVFDVLLGFLYAGLVMGAWSWVEAQRRLRAPPD